MRVRMIPEPSQTSGESGINTVVRQYMAHLPALGVTFTQADDFDVLMVHAGMVGNFPANVPLVACCHGLYWTADHPSPAWEYKANENVIASIRYARAVTVPSPWVAETFARDMRFTPHVVPHGVNWQAWQHAKPADAFILGYAKNRADSDVCSPAFLGPLAARRPDLRFVATFGPKGLPNLETTGVIPYGEMRDLTQRAAVFISPIKETFGLHALEALAAGTPVMTPNHGGVLQFVQHGVNGYIYDPEDEDDLSAGLDYCQKNRAVLSHNARALARAWTWEKACEKLCAVLAQAAHPEPPTVGFVVPYYNKPTEQLTRAIASLLAQTQAVAKIVVVDDGSHDPQAAAQVCQQYDPARVQYVRQENGGVSAARNKGASLLDTKYLGFLDADDWLQPGFVEACWRALEADNSLHLAYTKMRWTNPITQASEVSGWPGVWDFDRQITPRSAHNARGFNQVPTANLMRRETFVRLGGYRSRFEGRGGAGAEDAELWTRMGAYGYKAALATEAPLFEYTAGTGITSQKDWAEAPWLGHLPFVVDKRHPFASHATPARFSHPVRQYDEPVISVIIPVGPRHFAHVPAALDSLDAQTFRKWEAIVVDDTGEFDHLARSRLETAYPYARWVTTQGAQGAGYARNRGADVARGQFVVFLDADDNLENTALEHMLDTWHAHQMGVYTDYVGLVTPMGSPDRLIAEVNLDPYREVLSWDGRTLAIRHQAAHEWDWARAQRQPTPGENPYVPCLVTTLIPRAWHLEIGGFDEKMMSWEDVDYYWRLARAGKCMLRLPEPLVIYRFGTGHRREAGLQAYGILLEYLTEKYTHKEIAPPVPCNCGGNKTPPSNPTGNNMLSSPSQIPDTEMVLVTLATQNTGISKVIGFVTRTSYGYRERSEQFYAKRTDVYNPNGTLINPPQFNVVNRAVPAPKVSRALPLAPSALDDPTLPAFAAPVTPVAVRLANFASPDPGLQLLSEVPGIGQATAARLRDAGLNTLNELLTSGGETALIQAGLPPKTANRVYTEIIRLTESPA